MMDSKLPMSPTTTNTCPTTNGRRPVHAFRGGQASFAIMSSLVSFVLTWSPPLLRFPVPVAGVVVVTSFPFPALRTASVAVVTSSRRVVVSFPPWVIGRVWLLV
ncbi:hypothetical protein BaRGS_00032941 [Batillaria attramentaria]|uniref:Uncharacterized protein n=1 Tax=Batillaria attramentaria TaxID=370345 RepID=A0ABD0JM78_9CAEN